jgi:Spy/CpxP family protein refolding chaperone
VNGKRGIAIAILAAFVIGCSSGLVAGILLMRFTAPWGPPFGLLRHGGPWGIAGHREPGGPRGGPGEEPGGPGIMRPDRLLGHLERALDLTPEQQDRIRAVLDRTRVQAEALHESTHAQIESLLTVEQRARWRAMEERYREAWRGRGGRRPAPDPDPEP